MGAHVQHTKNTFACEKLDYTMSAIMGKHGTGGTTDGTTDGTDIPADLAKSMADMLCDCYDDFSDTEREKCKEKKFQPAEGFAQFKQAHLERSMVLHKFISQSSAAAPLLPSDCAGTDKPVFNCHKASCRKPGTDAECAALDSANPKYDASEPTNCRALVASDCGNDGRGPVFESSKYIDITAPGNTITAFASGDYSSKSPSKEQVKNAIGDEIANSSQSVSVQRGSKYLNFGGANDNPSGLVVTTGGGVVTALSLTSANDAPARDPKKFTLEGTNDITLGKNVDDATFTKITTGEVAFTDRHQKQTIQFANSKNYTDYRLTVETTAGKSTCCMQVGEIELLKEEGGECRLPENDDECATINPATPVFDTKITDPCPWINLGNTDTNNLLQCFDGSYCNGSTQGWDCCAKRGGRARCPPNYKTMCNTPNQCGSKTAYCCEMDCSSKGGNRPCPSEGPGKNAAQKTTKCRARKQSDCAGDTLLGENGECRAPFPSVAEKAAKDHCTNACKTIDWTSNTALPDSGSEAYGGNNNHVFKIVNGQFAEGAAKDAYLGCFHDNWPHERALCPYGVGECTEDRQRERKALGSSVCQHSAISVCGKVSRVPSEGPGKCLDVCLAKSNITNDNLKYIGLAWDGECFCSTNPDPKTGFAKFCEQKKPAGWTQFIAGSRQHMTVTCGTAARARAAFRSKKKSAIFYPFFFFSVDLKQKMSVLKHEINRIEEAIGRQLSLRRRFNRLIAHHLAPNNALQGGAGCTPSKRSKYHKLSRKSPPIPANECEAGIVETGNDGRKYVAKPNKNNVNRWVLVKPAKKPRKRRKQQHKPAQTDKDGWIGRRPRKTPAAPHWVPRRPQIPVSLDSDNDDDDDDDEMSQSLIPAASPPEIISLVSDDDDDDEMSQSLIPAAPSSRRARDIPEDSGDSDGENVPELNSK